MLCRENIVNYVLLFKKAIVNQPELKDETRTRNNAVIEYFPMDLMVLMRL